MSTVLLIFAWVVMLFPYLMGLFTIIDIDRFRRSAFGLYSTSSGALIVAILLALAYYALVLAHNLRGGAAQAMSVWPLGLDGVFLYVQCVFVIGTVVAFRVTSMRLLNIITPLRKELDEAKAKLAALEKTNP